MKKIITVFLLCFSGLSCHNGIRMQMDLHQWNGETQNEIRRKCASSSRDSFLLDLYRSRLADLRSDSFTSRRTKFLDEIAKVRLSTFVTIIEYQTSGEMINTLAILHSSGAARLYRYMAGRWTQIEQVELSNAQDSFLYPSAKLCGRNNGDLILTHIDLSSGKISTRYFLPFSFSFNDAALNNVLF